MSKYKLFECHNQEGITCDGGHISLRLAVAELNSLEYQQAELKKEVKSLKSQRNESLQSVQELTEENEDLKAQVKNLSVAHYDLIEIEQETDQENEALKAKVDKLSSIIDTAHAKLCNMKSVEWEEVTSELQELLEL